MNEFPVDPAVARWRRVHELFDEVADLDAEARRLRLRETCDDDALRLEIEALLAYDDSSSDQMQRVVADAARATLPDVEVDDMLPTGFFLGRYRIVEKLGDGGMGEVYLADDTTLDRHVAVKLPALPLAGDPESRNRVLREARAAATLNHPHVCIVHEVGEAPDGRPFIAMEYLQGETLAARIARRPLTPDEAIVLGIDAASALGAAHARGVVHRDLKPSNIILTPHGCKVLDFGVASLARDAARDPANATGAVMGTLRYMSPEQARGNVVDHRSDLFSLGVVLYEAVTGRRPFEGATPGDVRTATLEATPPPPGRIVSHLPHGFDAVVMCLLRKDADARYQRAADVEAALAALRGVRRPPWLSWMVGAVALAAAAAVAVVATRPSVPVGPPRTSATVLVAGFANETDDAAFVGTLRRALVVQLEQTPFIVVVPDGGVRETLRQMGRPLDTPLSREVAQDVARRRGITAWVEGTVTRVRDRYVVRVVATDGSSGDVVATGEADAATRAGVLGALDRAVTELRRTLGESSRSLQRFSTPLEQATTNSFDALRAYALGVQQADRGEYALALSLFQRATEIDPDFALAHQALASQAMNTGYAARVVSAASRAFALRDRVTVEERHGIVYFYHLSVTGDLDRGIEDALRWQQTYPQEWRPYHALSNLYLGAGDHVNAAEAARQAVRLNPDSAASYSNLGGALFALGRFDEAKGVYRAAMARGFDAPEYRAFLWRIAHYAGDTAAMRQHLEWAASSATWARHMPALAAMLQGRWRHAQEISAESVAFFEAREMTGLTALAARYAAVAAALFDDCRLGRQEADRALARTETTPDEQARSVLVLALCGEARRAQRLADGLRTRHPQDVNVARVWWPLIMAAAALDRGDAAAALDVLAPALPWAGAAEGLPVYLHGLALLEAGNGAEARAAFEDVLAHPGRTFWVPLVPLAHLGRARAAAWTGDTDAALAAYADLFTLWRDADQDLPVLRQAHREAALLAAR